MGTNAATVVSTPERDRHEHAPGTLDGACQLARPFALRHVGGLAYDHCVVNQEPKNQNEADERDRVDRDAPGRRAGTRHRAGRSGCPPQPRAPNAAAETARAPLGPASSPCNPLSINVARRSTSNDDWSFHTVSLTPLRIFRRRTRPRSPCTWAEISRRSWLPDLRDAYQRCRTAIEAELLPRVREAVHDAGDILHEHARAVVARGHLDPAEFLSPRSACPCVRSSSSPRSVLIAPPGRSRELPRMAFAT